MNLTVVAATPRRRRQTRVSPQAKHRCIAWHE
jgi:hypothetical protein